MTEGVGNRVQRKVILGGQLFVYVWSSTTSRSHSVAPMITLEFVVVVIIFVLDYKLWCKGLVFVPSVPEESGPRRRPSSTRPTSQKRWAHFPVQNLREGRAAEPQTVQDLLVFRGTSLHERRRKEVTYFV